MSNLTVLVTGAGGHLGRRIVELLLEEPTRPRIVATSRTPDALADLATRGVVVRGADFDRPATLGPAFAGVDRAVLVSTDALDRPGRRLAQHQAAIRGLEATDVRHVVYTSAHHAPSIGGIAADHLGTEAALAASRLSHTILRNNLYTDLLLAVLPAALATGRLVDARADGGAGFVTREDCARAAAAAVLASGSGRRALEITGPELVTSADVARIASAVFGRPIVHERVSFEALVAGMVAHGLPEGVARTFAAFDTAIERGEFAATSAALIELTGRPAQSTRDFLAAHRAALAA